MSFRVCVCVWVSVCVSDNFLSQNWGAAEIFSDPDENEQLMIFYQQKFISICTKYRQTYQVNDWYTVAYLMLEVGR